MAFIRINDGRCCLRRQRVGECLRYGIRRRYGARTAG